MDTTEDFAVRFDTVAHDTAIAVRANRRQRVDCALEAVEDVTLSCHDHFKRLVILVFANFAFRHTPIRSRERRFVAVFIHRRVREFSSQPATQNTRRSSNDEPRCMFGACLVKHSLGCEDTE